MLCCRNAIERSIKEEEIKITNLERELSQSKAQRNAERDFHESAVGELKNFRLAKNTRLNSINSIVAILRDQIYTLGQQAHNELTTEPTEFATKASKSSSSLLPPKDSGDALLVFSNDSLKQLQTRTEELKSERAMQKNKFREDRQAYFALQSECKDLTAKIASLDSQCSIEMVKRFGESITMQDIESFAVNRTLEEMKEIARRKEESRYKEIKVIEVSIV